MTLNPCRAPRLLLALALAATVTACSRAEPRSPVPGPAEPSGPLGEPVEPREPVDPPVDTVRPPEPEPEPEPVPVDTARPAEPVDPAPVVGPAGLPILPGSVLPRQRIVAFYGNPVSTRMGILGELPPDEMLSLLDREVAAWQAADPATPVKPALHMIAVMATGDPGQDSLYRLRMPDRRIREVVEWANRRDALVFLDIQPGRSSVPQELPRLAEWLEGPDVHLALDPEWAMEEDELPGRKIGSMSADDINFAIRFLADLVEEHDLPPKVLVVHRFTQAMLRNVDDIELDPRVQLVINMDGWGPPSMKITSYREIVAPEAPQYTGFKLFYKNDLRDGSRLLTPHEILALRPVPLYIQYQ